MEAPLPEKRAEISALFDWMRRNLHRELSIDTLARRANMSQRTLIRRFHETVGCAPKLWILSERLNRARNLLEASSRSVEQLHTSPAAYRRRFAEPV